jgi:hypothetical protein
MATSVHRAQAYLRPLPASALSLELNGLLLVFSLHLTPEIWGPTMTLKLKRIGEQYGTRICLAGELRCSHLINVRAEIEQVGNLAILDMDEVDVVDVDGVRFLNECLERSIKVVNCSPYIREWMLQEKRISGGET